MTEDEQALARYGEALVRAIELALGDWVDACVRDTLADQGRSIDDETIALIAAARDEALRTVSAELRAALSLDVDEQRQNPLSILRAAVRYPTRVLRSVGAQPMERDEFDRKSFPADEFALTPAAFSDFGPAVHEAGIMWGAAKAHVHLQRRRAQEQ